MDVARWLRPGGLPRRNERWTLRQWSGDANAVYPEGDPGSWRPPLRGPVRAP
jgi:hypothetical protein